MKTIIGWLKFLITLYLLVGAFLFFFQDNFLYFPSTERPHSFQTRQFLTGKETINVIVLNKGQKKALIYFGGNGEAVVNNAESSTKIFTDHTVYLVNYRGYGGSTGVPDEQGFYSDAQFIYDEIEKQYQHISVMGRSLGTGVATFLASTRAIDKLVLVTPFDSILSIAQDHYPVYPVSLILTDKYESASRVKDILSETLIILAENDRVIPAKYSQQLIEAFPVSQVTVEIIKGAGHNNLSLNRRYHLLLKKFLQYQGTKRL